MIDIKNSSITYLLPMHLKQKTEVKALAFAINNMVGRLLNLCSRIGLYSRIDELDGEILDVLATELKTQFYDVSFDVEIKRKLVKNTIKWYMKTGTPLAVEEVVRAIFGEGKVIEWDKYGGKPFRFMIKTNGAIDDANVEKFKELIRNVKNVRSILDGVEIERGINSGYNYGSYTYGYYKMPDIR